jgi:hypothetical protein
VKAMNYIKVIILTLFAISCGTDEPKCVGKMGTFEGVPALSINSCMNVSPHLGLRNLKIDEESIYIKCGWHHQPYDGIIKFEGKDDCTQKINSSVQTTENGYRFFMVMYITCSDRRCMSVWETDLHEQEKKNE